MVKDKIIKMKQRRGDEAERELAQALLRMPQRAGPTNLCLQLDLLKRYVAGSLPDETRTRVLAHLDECPQCFETAVLLHKRHRWIRRSALALVAVFLIAVAGLWIWHPKPTMRSASVAIVDLRDAIRSNRHVDMQPVKAGSDTRQLRIMLPAYSAEAVYEIALFAAGSEDSDAVVRSLASTKMWDHRLELNVAFDFSRIAPGRYSLAIRHGEANWEYVPLLRE